jgi:arginyl-tRNA synthetase
LRDQELIHIKFGLVLGGDAKKLSTRAGKHISLSEVINEAVDKAGKVLGEKAPEIKGREKRRTAEIIGIDALKYNDLSQNRTSNILFDWEKMLAFEGNAAPYLLYTYARLRSIIKKSRAAAKVGRGFATEAEKRAALKLSEFPEVLGRAADNCAPHYLAEYLYELSEAMNNFYHAEPVLTAEPAVRASRLALVWTASIVLEKGIRTLGLETVERL